MLSGEERLRRSAEFTLAVRRGRRAGRGTLVVHLYSEGPGGSEGPEAGRAHGAPCSDTGGPSPRVGFVVPRAVGGAVVRNRVRRRLRHLVRPRLGQLPCGSLVVVRALPPAAQARHADLATDLDAAVSRVTRTSPPGREKGVRT